MNIDQQRVFTRYQELQRYVGWTAADADRVCRAGPLVAPAFAALVDDFYTEIERHPDALQVITGGPEQIERLKGTLVLWLEQLFSGTYDANYVFRRWQIGHRHVEIGLDQVYTNMALSRLRRGILDELDQRWPTSQAGLCETRRVINTLIDLDLALIEDAYQTEHIIRRQATERLVLIGQVAGGVAHELRNPLNVIRTSVFYLLNAQTPSAEKTAAHLHRIERQVGLAENVIAALVRFAKMPLPELRPIDVADLLREAVAAIEQPAKVEVVQDCPSNLGAALADEGQIRVVLENLIRNAYDAMPEGGRLVLSAAMLPPYIELRVSDTGHGIEPDRLQRIMEPFYSTKARGVGLGLALSKAIVEKNEGRISAASQPGQGATFIVQLRAHQE